MDRRVTLTVTMELCSAAIFGSGHSVPGGEDIAVRVDREGWPYLSGTTLKGLLRESLENLLAWTGGPADLSGELLGKEGWEGTSTHRRLRITELTLEQRPQDPLDCFELRTFTAVKDGLAESQTLRQAACIRRGLRFSGRVLCAREDRELVTDALRAIKWAGTMRNRGFGRVAVSVCSAQQTAPVTWNVGPAACLHYRLHNVLPVQTIDLNHSYGYNYETRNWISGTAVRGAVMTALAEQMPDWFRSHRTGLLSGVRFLDAVPAPEGLAALPSIRGFYEDKNEEQFETVVVDGTLTEGNKRARLGSFCAIQGSQLIYWKARTDGMTRIDRKKKVMIQSRYLEAGQDFDGYILLEDPLLAPEIANAMSGTVWIGADRWEGFGECEVTSLEAVDRPAWAAYGFDREHLPGRTMYMLALTPFTMLNDLGEPCGLELDDLAELMGVHTVSDGGADPLCATSILECGGYNSTWQCRRPDLTMYDRGSIFRLDCDTAPDLEKLLAIQNRGLGVRTAESCGQVLFLRPELFEQISEKQKLDPKPRYVQTPAARLRLARYDWVTRTVPTVKNCKLSRSQLGSLQSLCEQAMAADGSRRELDEFLYKNLNDRGPRQADRFQIIKQLLDRVLDTPLSETLGVDCQDSVTARLELLILLFNHSRKE